MLLVSENRPEWCIADLGIMAAGCISVPAYTSNTERDHAHVLDDSRARAAIVSTQKLAATLIPAVLRSPQCGLVIGMEPIRTGQIGSFRTVDWASLVATPADVAACAADARFARSDTACIIYTSGTGGAPRGVLQHHGAILHNIAGAATIIAEDFGTSDERFLSFLPLSHAYEHTGGQYLPIWLGGEIWYAEGLEKLAANIEEVRPTIMVVVPRLFEVLRTRIAKGIEKQGPRAGRLLAAALALSERRAAGGGAGLRDRALDALLSLTLRRKVGKRFGGRIKAMVSGGAPLNPEVGRFFDALGLVILQGYGQTEAAPIIACNRPGAGIRMDSVGPPLKDVEVRIADDGEILVRGELVMHGYWRNEAETARVLRDGWLHTGDVGHLDDAGRLVITDRKKDIIVNDKGENVAPQRVEGMLTLQPEIAQAMVAGDRRPHLVGLVVPDGEWLADAGFPPGVSPEDGRLQRAMMAAVDRVNAQLAVQEKVRRILVTTDPFTIENAQLTPSLKIRRHKIREVYGPRMDALYGARRGAS